MTKQQFVDNLRKKMHGIHKEKIEGFLRVFEIIKIDLELFVNYFIEQDSCAIEYYFEKGNQQLAMYVSQYKTGICFYSDKIKRNLKPEEIIKIFPELIYVINLIAC